MLCVVGVAQLYLMFALDIAINCLCVVCSMKFGKPLYDRCFGLCELCGQRDAKTGRESVSTSMLRLSHKCIDDALL